MTGPALGEHIAQHHYRARRRKRIEKRLSDDPQGEGHIVFPEAGERRALGDTENNTPCPGSTCEAPTNDTKGNDNDATP